VSRPRRGVASPAGELLMVGLPGPALDDGAARRLESLRPGGVILFRRNVESEPQLLDLVREVRRRAPGTLLFVDAEGGRVDRFAPVVGPAPAAARLAAAPPAWSRRAGLWVGQALRGFDCDVDLAPVVDLDHRPGERRDNALDGRCLGSRPVAVAARGRAFLRGLHSAGVGGCVKHFPGLGGAGEDTHTQGSVVALAAGALADDLRPFELLAAEAAAVLVGHAVYPALDPAGLPASLSPAIAGRLLRRRLGFRGLAISDDLAMRAVADLGSLPEVAEAALAAGCDLLPVCHSLEAALEVAARLSRRRLAGRVREAAGRVRRYRRHLRGVLRGARRPGSLAEVRRRLRDLDEGLNRAAGRVTS
jgi:beta-N-acetylhexosaminidase